MPLKITGILTLLFMIGIGAVSQSFAQGFQQPAVLVVAALLAGYIALNIGANDAGNNIGPLVGSAVISLTGAMLLAAVFEMAGALLAGDEVISTIQQGIVDPERIGDSSVVVKVMLSAMLASALWLHFATLSRMPVSTTHTIVGGVLGASITVGGTLAIDWTLLGTITVSWLASPLLGSLIAALLLYLIKRTITYQADMSRAAEKIVPLLVGLMAWSFTSYLLVKGLKASWRVDLLTALLCGLSVGAGVYLIIKPTIKQRTALLPNTKSAVNRHFNLPLLLAASLLSFAHGSNDVANAIGPLIAVKEALMQMPELTPPGSAVWLLLIGAFGIPLGLLLFGRRMITTLASEITELDQVRAFCIVTSVTITVLVASQLGIPVSSTHTAVGAIFGIGFLREILKTRYAVSLEMIRRHKKGENEAEIEAFISRYDASSLREKGLLLKTISQSDTAPAISKKDRRDLEKLYHRELVTRTAFRRIIAAWIITLPATGLVAALIYLLMFALWG
ncbi:MAG: inorganic phosphate transporter [Candidatus Thiodiazotropha sp.]